MARIPNPKTDFEVTVDGIGTFTVGRRKMADELKIQVEYARIVDGVKPTEWLDIVANWISVFKVLIVFAPPSWDLDEMDPLDEPSYEKMGRVFKAIRDKELSFRKGTVQSSQAASEGTGSDNPVPVAPALPATGN